MATWIDVPGADAVYSGGCNYISLKVHLQYDADSASPNSITCRTKAYKTKNYSTTDTYFIYSKDGSISVICYLCSAVTSKDNPYYSHTFTIKKSLTDTHFTIPALKICNDGSYWPKSLYTDNNGRGADVYWSSGRTGYQTNLTDGKSTIKTDAYVTSIGLGSTTIIDNYNNTFTITATKGADGNYNTAGGPTNLKYGYASTSRNTTYTSGTAISLALSGTGNTRTVYAESTTTAEVGDNKTATNSLAIRQYRAPNAPGTPDLTPESYKNGRLTVKQNWTWTWTPATPGTGTGTTIGTGTNQTTSKVTGYRVLLLRKRPTENAFTSIPIKSGATTLSTSSGDEHFYDISANSIEINPIACGIEAGDQVKLSIRPYTQYGANNTGNKLFRPLTTESVEATVQNAGVMRVKPNDTIGWKEGVVWVKVNKGGTAKWVEADVVQTKTSTGWKESI